MLASLKPVIGLPKDNLLSSRNYLIARDLDKIAVVTCGYRSEFSRTMLAACAKAQSFPDIKLNVNDFNKASTFARNLDIGYISVSSAVPIPKDYLEIPLAIPELESLGIYAIRSQSRRISPASAHLWEAYSKCASTNVPEAFTSESWLTMTNPIPR